MDLEDDKRLEGMDLVLVSIVVDPLPEVKKEMEEQGIAAKSPVVSDRSKGICGSYGINCQHMGGKPGHAFVLVDKEGRIKWQKDYGGLMYVEVDELLREVAPRL